MPPDAPQPRPRLPKPSLSVYYNAARLRTDAWQRLKAAAKRLAHHDGEGALGASAKAAVEAELATLEPLESYWAFPGRKLLRDFRSWLDDEFYELLAEQASRVVRLLASQAYRGQVARALTETGALRRDELDLAEPGEGPAFALRDRRPYFEVIVVDDIAPREEEELKASLRRLRRDEDEFVYELVVVPSFEDALIAVMLNCLAQSVVIRYGFPLESPHRLPLLSRAMAGLDQEAYERMGDGEVGLALGKVIHGLRPHLDLYLVTDATVEDIAGRLGRRFRRVFYRQEDHRELHLSLLKGIRARFRAPFFSALKAYSQKPTGVFHALPISRGKSIARSHWIRDMEEFYGSNVFLAETSATTSGLDSLLQPHGSLKEAQELAARAFGARRSYFVTNGTSTANKIVMQALVRPDDLVLVARDCHQSHHYALVLAGAHPVYMDPYPLTKYSVFGAVPLHQIKRHLLALRREGKLDRVKVLLLTNCTFDGIVYNPERVMEEVLAIKPDIAFVWDEAWFGFAYFTPITRRRTAMDAANRLREKLRSPEYRKTYEAWRQGFAQRERRDEAWLEERLLPDPDLARVRVYATQSTHKTLTSLRQGSMIHVNDVDFETRARQPFHEAYLTHTSTSANYQILASLDVGRRQVELEGYELVQHSIELAMILRERVNGHPLLSKYFRMLTVEELVPAWFRASGFKTYRDARTDWVRMDQAWEEDEFCLDPTRLTLFVGQAGVEGDAFKRRLIEEHDIQINKTSRNTVLFMTHIGTTRGAVAYLIEVLNRVAEELEERREDESRMTRRLREEQVRALVEELPPLPDFSRFHDAFRPDPEGGTREGDLRSAFFGAGDDENCEYLRLDGSIENALAAGREVVAAAFITPYPPGFPLLVPGQVISPEILAFLKALDVKEIHGYEPEHGLRVFSEAYLRSRAPGPAGSNGGDAEAAEAQEAEGSGAAAS